MYEYGPAPFVTYELALLLEVLVYVGLGTPFGPYVATPEVFEADEYVFEVPLLEP